MSKRKLLPGKEQYFNTLFVNSHLAKQILDVEFPGWEKTHQLTLCETVSDVVEHPGSFLLRGKLEPIA